MAVEIEGAGDPVDEVRLAGDADLGIVVFLADLGEHMLDDERAAVIVEAVILVHLAMAKIAVTSIVSVTPQTSLPE